MHITGGCTVKGQQRSPADIVSAEAVSALLGNGAYAMSGALSVDGKGRPTDGSCGITPAGRETLPLLTIGVAASFDSSFKAARQTMRSDPRIPRLSGVDGYVIPDPSMDGDGKRVTGARVVTFEPDRMVVVRVLAPGDGGRRRESDPGDGRGRHAASLPAHGLTPPVGSCRVRPRAESTARPRGSHSGR
jgi:hypothetical protein